VSSIAESSHAGVGRSRGWACPTAEVSSAPVQVPKTAPYFLEQQWHRAQGRAGVMVWAVVVVTVTEGWH